MCLNVNYTVLELRLKAPGVQISAPSSYETPKKSMNHNKYDYHEPVLLTASDVYINGTKNASDRCGVA